MATPTRGTPLLRPLAVVVLLLQVALLFLVTALVGERAARSEREAALEAVRTAAGAIAPALVRDGLADAARLEIEVEAAAERSGHRVLAVDAAGTIVADSGALRPGDPAGTTRARDARAALARGASESTGTPAGEQVPVVRAARRLEGGDARLALLVERRRPATGLVPEVLRVLLVGSITLVLTTLLLFHLATRRIDRAVDRLARDAERYAAGDLGHRATIASTREFARLSAAIEHMAAELRGRIAELVAQRAEQRAILQSISSGMIALDLDHRVLSVNRTASELLLIDAAASRGRLLEELVREPELNRFLEAAFARPDRAEGEFKVGRGPSRLRVAAVSEPLVDTDERRIGVLILLNDVTELRRLESMRSDFAANVSHELRTPITTIKGYIETLLEVGFDDRGQAERFLDIVHRGATRLEAIIEDLLALANLEQAGGEAPRLEVATVPVGRIVADAVRHFAEKAEAKDIRVEVDAGACDEAVAPDEAILVTGAAQLVEQAVANLLSNAISYSPPGTTVRVTATRPDAEHVAIDVADEGPGIAEVHLPRIFERFYRVDQARSRKVGGTGLGLAIVKHVAMVHGGRAEVESRLGEGSTFRIVLPAAGGPLGGA